MSCTGESVRLWIRVVDPETRLHTWVPVEPAFCAGCVAEVVEGASVCDAYMFNWRGRLVSALDALFLPEGEVPC